MANTKKHPQDKKKQFCVGITLKHKDEFRRICNEKKFNQSDIIEEFIIEFNSINK